MANLDSVKRLIQRMAQSRAATATSNVFNRYVKRPVRHSMDKIDQAAERSRLIRGLRDGALKIGPMRVAKHVLKQTAKVHPGVAFGAGILGGAKAEYKHLDDARRKSEQAKRETERERNHTLRSRQRHAGQHDHEASHASDMLAKEAGVAFPWRKAQRAVRAFTSKLPAKEIAKKYVSETGKFIGDKAGGAVIGSTAAFFWVPQLHLMKNAPPQSRKPGSKYDDVALGIPTLQGMVRAEKQASATAILLTKMAVMNHDEGV